MILPGFLLLGPVLILCAAAGAGPPFSGADRARAVGRGLDFIYRTACDAKNFAGYGHDYLWFFNEIAATSADRALRAKARAMGRERALVWLRDNQHVPADADAESVANLAFGAYAAARLGVRSDAFKREIRRAALRFPVEDYLSFDPGREPPPTNVPKACSRCKAYSPRGASVCRRCGAPLQFRTRYDLWLDALITTYTGDHYGVTLGAPYAYVIRWLAAMRPYPSRNQTTQDEYYDIVYAITHVVYTLNDYNERRLSPKDLPEEFAYLRANFPRAVAAKDPETVGECLDSLRAFGLETSDPLIRQGIDYLLSTQNPDGSWYDPNSNDIYSRYHPTWTALDGLRDYRWKRAQKLRLPIPR